MSTGTRARLSPEVFRLPLAKLRSGYYSDAYFTHTKALLEAEGHRPHVLMQVFQREASFLGGVDEAVAILRGCTGRCAPDGGWIDGWDEVEVRALHEGDEIAPWETVMTIEGDYSLFAHLETVYLGCMARRTLVMRNVHEVVEAAGGKAILYFPARHDHWLVQTGDGWAAHVAGAIGVSTDAQASWWGGRGVGTVPHALIAAYGGSTVAAARTFARHFADQMRITVLVDFENDSVRTALEVADALGDDLWGVRLDTSERLADAGLVARMGRRPRRAASPPSSPSSSGPSSTVPATSGCGSWRRAASTRSASAPSRRPASPSTPTGSARRSSAAPTTSRPTSCSATGARWPRRAAACARTTASSSSPSPRLRAAARTARPPAGGA